MVSCGMLSLLACLIFPSLNQGVPCVCIVWLVELIYILYNLLLFSDKGTKKRVMKTHLWAMSLFHQAATADFLHSASHFFAPIGVNCMAARKVVIFLTSCNALYTTLHNVPDRKPVVWDSMNWKCFSNIKVINTLGFWSDGFICRKTTPKIDNVF